MVRRVLPDEAKQLMDEGWTYLDVRSVREFEGGHPEGAYNIPLLDLGPGGMQPNPDFMAAAERTFPRDARLVVGCGSGGRSLRAASMLEAAGFQNVIDQRAGFGGSQDALGRVEQGWAARGLPVSRAAAPGRSWRELAGKAAAQ
jgi:rhodanese-related sulfurtransferase